MNQSPSPPRKPAWLKRRLPTGDGYARVRELIEAGRLHTVCQEAKCPNIWECFSHRTATFLIMGERCTRNCRFCSVHSGVPEPLDPGEPGRVAEAAAGMELKYVVVTSVTRDDLPDGGAAHFAATIRAVRGRIPGAEIEVLIPDLQGDRAALRTVLDARPDVLNHNIETVPRLYPHVRPQADYRRSLELLRTAGEIAPSIPTKSGLMLGLGETPAEVQQTLQDLRAHGCRLLTLGQYLQPSQAHLPVAAYVPPEEFERWRTVALELGFTHVASAPFVRSSYHAGESFEEAKKDELIGFIEFIGFVGLKRMKEPRHDSLISGLSCFLPLNPINPTNSITLQTHRSSMKPLIWAEIDLGAIAGNLRELRRLTDPRAKVMAVVKADGYGHGACEVARTALAAGAEWLGVARLHEAVRLREAGLAAPLLVLGYTPPEDAERLVEFDLRQSVYSLEAAESYSAAARRRGGRIRVHLKIDTGMGRLGLVPAALSPPPATGTRWETTCCARPRPSRACRGSRPKASSRISPRRTAPTRATPAGSCGSSWRCSRG